MGHELAIDFASAIAAAGPVCCNMCGGTDHRHLFRKFGYDLLRCRHCSLVFVGNPPGAAEVAAFSSAEADYHGALLDPTGPAFARMTEIARQRARMLRRAVPSGQGLKLLDIGCSSGLFLDKARAVGFVARGAERSLGTAAFAREQFGLEVHAGDWREAGYADASFDVVTLFDGVARLPDPLAELRAIRRLLKPGGVLLQSAPNIDGLFPRMSYKAARLLDYWPHPEPPRHLYQFSDRTLAEMTERAGYEVTRVDQARIGFGCSFGTAANWKTSPRLLAYALLFAPSAIVGPWFGMGDRLYLTARRP